MQIAKEAFLQLGFPSQDQTQAETSAETSAWRWYHLLPVAAAAIYIFTPILSWRFGVPGAVKFLGDALVIVMIGLAIGRMIMTDRVPGMFLVILALTVIGAIVATFEGQSAVVTFYGWWMMFRYPMVGLYIYLVPDWPKNTAALLPKVLLGVLIFQVLVQIALYMAGVRDFDNLAGTFGQKGVGPFAYFIILVLAIALGRWLVIGEWKMLIITLGLGAFASAMGEMKLFIIAAPMLALVALGVHLLKGAQPRKMFIYLAFFAITAGSFLYAYDKFIVEGLGKPPLADFLNSEKRDRYLDYARGYNGSYLLGRTSEVEYGWQLLQRDETTMIFGHGLGTRQYSVELGLIGQGLVGSIYGLFVGRSLLVIAYETGLAGILVLLIFTAITIISLYRATKADPDADMNALRFGILFYTLFWPLWIWYKQVWIMSAPAMLYWMFWGFVMHYTVGYSFQRSPQPLSIEKQIEIDSKQSLRVHS